MTVEPAQVSPEVARLDLDASKAFNETFEQIKKSFEKAQFKFYTPEGAYLSRRVVDSIYAGGAKELGLANDVKLNVHRDHAVPSLSKRLQAYGFKKEVGAPSPSSVNPPTLITTAGGYVAPSTISPGHSAPAAPSWMLKNRAPGLQQAAYGTRRSSGTGVAVKRGLERDSHASQMSVDEVIAIQNRARLEKQKEEDEKRRIKEAAEQEKERKIQERRAAAEEKRIAAEDRKAAAAQKRAEIKAAKEEEARLIREAREMAEQEKREQQEAKARAEKDRREKERAKLLEASRLENEAAGMKDAEHALQSRKPKSPGGEDDVTEPTKKRRTSRSAASDNVKSEDEQAAAPDTKKRRVGSARLTRSAKSTTDSPPAEPSNTGQGAQDAKPPPPPAAGQLTYEALIGDATLPANDEASLRAFLSGDFEGKSGTHLIPLSDAPADGGKRRIVSIKLDYETGKIAKVAKVVGGKKKRPSAA
ncbi:hypothetical protein HDU86_004116 [Geranomyces michiganensis]|nr:hypothetical protein HDU86_004116 [Geranomyces michiganensis]